MTESKLTKNISVIFQPNQDKSLEHYFVGYKGAEKMIRFNVVLEDADKSKKSYEKFYACGVYDKCDGGLGLGEGDIRNHFVNEFLKIIEKMEKNTDIIIQMNDFLSTLPTDHQLESHLQRDLWSGLLKSPHSWLLSYDYYIGLIRVPIGV